MDNSYTAINVCIWNANFYFTLLRTSLFQMFNFLFTLLRTSTIAFIFFVQISLNSATLPFTSSLQLSKGCKHKLPTVHQYHNLSLFCSIVKHKIIIIIQNPIAKNNFLCLTFTMHYAASPFTLSLPILPIICMVGFGFTLPLNHSIRP